MKKFPYNYLGICITNKDPEYRGRVKIFIPSVMPALYEDWNKENADITLECVGDNLVSGLDSKTVERLEKILPWAECASPIIGSSVAGQYSSLATGGTGQFNQNTNGPDPASGGGEGSANIAGGVAPTLGGGDRVNQQQLYNQIYDSLKSKLGNTSVPSDITKYGVSADLHGLTTLMMKVANKESSFYNSADGDAGYFSGTASDGSTIPGGSHGLFQLSPVDAQTYNFLGFKGNGPTIKGTGISSFTINQLQDPNFNVDLTTSIWAWSIGKYGTVGNKITKGYGWIADREMGKLSRYSGQGLAEGYTPVDVNDPTSPPDTSAIGSVTVPFNTPDGNPTQTVPEDPGQPSVQTQGTTLSGAQAAGTAAQGVAGGTGSGSNYNAFFNSNSFRQSLAARGNSNPVQVNGAWKSNGGSGATLCAAGALITSGYITGNNGIKTATIGSATNLAQSSSNALTRSGLYNKQTFPSNYTPQNGDVVAMAGGSQGYGHALTYLNGQWYAHRSGDNSPSTYLASGRYNSPALYRLNDAGIAAMQQAGVADGSMVFPAGPSATTGTGEAGIDGQDAPSSTTMIQHTTPTQASPIDTTGMAQGMFVYPNPGALLWVFFREGDPMFPVYFAASYGKNEWQSAYQGGSAPMYYPAEKDDPNKIVNKTVMRFNAAGLLEANGTVTGEQDFRSLTLAHANGGHLMFHPTGSIHYSPNEHMEQVAGNKYSYRLNSESWTQGVDNKVVLGNQFIKVGNPSQQNVEVIDELQQKIKEVNEIMLA